MLINYIKYTGPTILGVYNQPILLYNKIYKLNIPIDLLNFNKKFYICIDIIDESGYPSVYEMSTNNIETIRESNLEKLLNYNEIT